MQVILMCEPTHVLCVLLFLLFFFSSGSHSPVDNSAPSDLNATMVLSSTFQQPQNGVLEENLNVTNVISLKTHSLNNTITKNLNSTFDTSTETVVKSPLSRYSFVSVDSGENELEVSARSRLAKAINANSTVVRDLDATFNTDREEKTGSPKWFSFIESPEKGEVNREREKTGPSKDEKDILNSVREQLLNASLDANHDDTVNDVLAKAFGAIDINATFSRNSTPKKNEEVAQLFMVARDQLINATYNTESIEPQITNDAQTVENCLKNVAVNSLDSTREQLINATYNTETARKSFKRFSLVESGNATFNKIVNNDSVKALDATRTLAREQLINATFNYEAVRKSPKRFSLIESDKEFALNSETVTKSPKHISLVGSEKEFALNSETVTQSPKDVSLLGSEKKFETVTSSPKHVSLLESEKEFVLNSETVTKRVGFERESALNSETITTSPKRFGLIEVLNSETVMESPKRFSLVEPEMNSTESIVAALPNAEEVKGFKRFSYVELQEKRGKRGSIISAGSADSLDYLSSLSNSGSSRASSGRMMDAVENPEHCK